MTYCHERAIIDIPLKGFIFLCIFLHGKNRFYVRMVDRSQIDTADTGYGKIGSAYLSEEGTTGLFEGGKKQIRYAGGADMRVKITLACTECKQRNYNTMKNKKNDPDRLEMNKYCRFCRKHTLHKETK